MNNFVAKDKLTIPQISYFVIRNKLPLLSIILIIFLLIGSIIGWGSLDWLEKYLKINFFNTIPVLLTISSILIATVVFEVSGYNSEMEKISNFISEEENSSNISSYLHFTKVASEILDGENGKITIDCFILQMREKLGLKDNSKINQFLEKFHETHAKKWERYDQIMEFIALIIIYIFFVIILWLFRQFLETNIQFINYIKYYISIVNIFFIGNILVDFLRIIRKVLGYSRSYSKL